eukprot:scaffold2349_cov110-Cylindrotheca_fusiformis.AAC.3
MEVRSFKVIKEGNTYWVWQEKESFLRDMQKTQENEGANMPNHLLWRFDYYASFSSLLTTK